MWKKEMTLNRVLSIKLTPQVSLTQQFQAQTQLEVQVVLRKSMAGGM